MHAAENRAEPTAASTTSGAAAAERLRGFANDLAALIAALGGLASAEASLSLKAFLRMLGLSAIGLVLVALAVSLLAVAGTAVLARALDSTAAALVIVAISALVGAALLLWRASIWQRRIGFAQTRAALLAKSPSSEDSAP